MIEALLRFYKRWLSPLLPAECKYVPTCSEYAAQAIACHGALRGGLMALWRLLRCHPFARGGHDPVPAAGLYTPAARLHTNDQLCACGNGRARSAPHRA